MSKKGGYKIVSLGGLDLLGESLALSGLYDALKLSHGKPILLTGIVIDGEKKKDALVQADEGENKINIKNLYGYDLEVAKSGDAITVTESPDGIELPSPEVEDAGKIVGVNNQGKYALQDSVKKQVEDGAVAGTIQDVLGLDSSGNLVKGSVGGNKIYRHSISMIYTNVGGMSLDVYSDSNTPLTFTTLKDYLESIYTANKYIAGSGFMVVASVSYHVIGFACETSSTVIYAKCMYNDNGTVKTMNRNIASGDVSSNFYDLVTEL